MMLQKMIIPTLLAMIISLDAYGQSAKDIVDQYTRRNALGIRNGVANLKMVIKDKKGRTKSRDLKLKVFEKSSDKASLVHVTKPANLSGTALLFREDTKKDSSQMHLYLPKFGKVRRIGDGQKKSPFVSSDFTYGDMDGSYFNGAKLNRLEDKTVSGFPCFQVEVFPLKTYTVAKRVVLLIRKDSYLADSIQYFDKADKVYKLFKLVKWEKSGEQWIASQSQMWNKKKNSITAIAIANIDAKQKLNLSMFTPERMKND